MAVQVIAEHGHTQGSVLAPPASQPTLGRVNLTVLLRLAILGPHEFRGQRDHFVTTWLDHDRRQHRMEVCHRAVGVLLGRAVRAMNLLRGKVAGPLQRKQQLVAHRAVGLNHPSLLQALEIYRETSDTPGWGPRHQVTNGWDCPSGPDAPRTASGHCLSLACPASSADAPKTTDSA